MRRLVNSPKYEVKYPYTKEIRNLEKVDDYSCLSESDRQEIITMIVEFCWDNMQIIQMMPTVSIGTIAAFRAHVTRGTYD